MLARSVLQRAALAARLGQPGSGAVLRCFASDMHDDFKPQFKDKPAMTVQDSIAEARLVAFPCSIIGLQMLQDLASHRVFLYMKGDPTAPQCGFSQMACRILDAYGVEYGSRNVLADPEIREGVKQFSAWPTIPQVYVDGEFIGGSDILMKLHQDGDLESMLRGGAKTESA